MAQSNATDPRADRLAMATAAIDAMKGDYIVQLQNDLVNLKAIWASVDVESPDETLLDSLFEGAHNLKGQAGTFGYDLVTSIAASLCDLLRSDRANPNRMNAVGQHVSVLGRVVEKNIVGPGGETGAKIVKALQALSKT